MIKLTSIKMENYRNALITAFADTKEEVTQGMTIIGLPIDITPSAGSSIITADGDVSFLKSDGTWNWIGE